MKRTLVLVAALLLPARAIGQSDVAAAEVLYDDAMKARTRRDFATACPKFAESYRLDPSTAPTLVMVGECEEKSGKLADAWGHLQEALPKLRDPGQVAYAKKLVASLEKRIPRLTVRLAAGAPEGTTVKRDGVELRSASLGAALPVNPGEHTIVVTAPGRTTATFPISVAEGKSAELGVTTGEPAPPRVAAASEEARGGAPYADGANGSDGPDPTDGPVKPARPGGTQRTVGYVIGGVGVAGIAVGIVELVRRASLNAEANACVPDPACSQPELTDKKNRTGAAGTIGVVGLVAGGALLAGGVALVLTAPSGPPVGAGRFWIVPSVGRSVGRLDVGGSF